MRAGTPHCIRTRCRAVRATGGSAATSAGSQQGLRVRLHYMDATQPIPAQAVGGASWALTRRCQLDRIGVLVGWLGECGVGERAVQQFEMRPRCPGRPLRQRTIPTPVEEAARSEAVGKKS